MKQLNFYTNRRQWHSFLSFLLFFLFSLFSKNLFIRPLYMRVCLCVCLDDSFAIILYVHRPQTQWFTCGKNTAWHRHWWNYINDNAVCVTFEWYISLLHAMHSTLFDTQSTESTLCIGIAQKIKQTKRRWPRSDMHVADFIWMCILWIGARANGESFIVCQFLFIPSSCQPNIFRARMRLQHKHTHRHTCILFCDIHCRLVTSHRYE